MGRPRGSKNKPKPQAAPQVENTLGQWPAGRRLRESSAERLLAIKPYSVTCGWKGCEESFEGLHADVQDALASHRREEHPDFVPYKRPRVKRPKAVG